MAHCEGVVASGDWCAVTLVTPARWKEVEAVFEQVRELSESERPAFLTKTCGGDEELRREVESLLASEAKAGEFIDRRSLFFSAETLPETGVTVPTGQLIGHYRVLREIGRG